MTYILTDIGGEHLLRVDGSWTPMRLAHSDGLAVFHRRDDAELAVKLLAAQSCYCLAVEANLLTCRPEAP